MKKFMLPAAVAVSAVLGVGGYSLVSNSTTQPVALTASSTQKTVPPVKCHPKAASGSSAATSNCRYSKGKLIKVLEKRTVHAEFIVRGKSNTWVTVDVDKGSVTSVSSTSITISRPDGVSVTAPITSSTKFRGLSESQITSGDKAIVVEKNHSAIIVLSRAPKAAAGTATPSA